MPIITFVLSGFFLRCLAAFFFVSFFFSFLACDIWMNLVFHALFALKVGVYFLIGANFSEFDL